MIQKNDSFYFTKQHTPVFNLLPKHSTKILQNVYGVRKHMFFSYSVYILQFLYTMCVPKFGDDNISEMGDQRNEDLGAVAQWKGSASCWFNYHPCHCVATLDKLLAGHCFTPLIRSLKNDNWRLIKIAFNINI